MADTDGSGGLMPTNVPVDLPTLADLTRIQAEGYPHEPAIGQGIDGPVLTWQEFDDRGNRAANALREHVGQGDRVAFLCDPSVDHATMWNGAVKAGCTVSNLHTKVAPDILRYCIDELRPRVLVLDETYSERFRETVRGEITTNLDAIVTLGAPRADDEIPRSTFLDADDPAEPDILVNPTDIAGVLWTSGTTGLPKGWCHTSRGLVLKALKIDNVARSTRSPQIYSPGFAAWWASSIPALVCGGTMFFLRDWSPGEYLELIEARELTRAGLVPTMWREILRRDDFDEYDLSSLESVGASGERLDANTLEAIRERVCEDVSNAYAATEVNANHITNEEMDGERIRSVGRPIPGTRIRIVPEDGDPDEQLPPGEVGEIIVKGEDRAVWAWGDTAKTEDVFRDGWWYSGDLGYQDEDGYLFLEGRADFMILSKGIKVYPVPVEERLNAYPGVEEAAVVGVDDEEYGEMVTAVVCRSDPSVTAETLDEWCLEAEVLARHERPREYHFVGEDLPKTATEKLDRAAVKSDIIES